MSGMSEDESDVENNELDEEYDFKPSYVVIAIDTHPDMFIKNEDGTTPFRNCLGACHTLADSLVLKVDKRSWTPFAVVMAKQHIAFIDFENNILDTVKLLETKLSLNDKQLYDEFVRKQDLELSNFLLCCKKIFQKINSPFYRRTLLYITNDDDPVPVKLKDKRFKAFNEIKTFPASQIDFLMVSTKEDFNYKLFYNELFSLIDNPPVMDICQDQEGLEEKLSSVVKVKQIRRTMMFYPFKDDQTRYIKCVSTDPIHLKGLYNKTVTKDGKKIKENNVTIDEEPMYAVKCSKLERTQQNMFDSNEKNNVYDFTLPIGLTLLYVCKRITDVGFVVCKPRLIQEADETSPYFRKFWQCCVDRDRVLVCAFKIKKCDKIRYSELIPTMMNNSPAFLCKRIPFATEISMPPKQEYPEPDLKPERKQLFKSLVDKLTFEFNLDMIPDPCFIKKKEYVKAKLLDRQMEEVSNVTFNKETLDAHLRDTVDKLNSEFVFVEEKKRKATSRATSGKKRK